MPARNILFVPFTFLVFQKRKTLALSEDPEGISYRVKEDIYLAFRNIWGKEIEKTLDVAARSSLRRHRVFPYFYFLT
jgi:hypothetical protein